MASLGLTSAFPRRRGWSGALMRQFQADYVLPIAFVYAYTGAQDLENARRWISEACRLRDPILRLVPTDPILRELCSAPEIRRLRTTSKGQRTQIPK
jgi:hypothetical protein